MDQSQQEEDAQDLYDTLDLTFQATPESLPRLSSAQLAALDLRLELLAPAPQHAQLIRQAYKLWERRNWIHMETATPVVNPPPRPEDHHALSLDFVGELDALSTAQLLAIKFQDDVSEARKEAANDLIIKRRKRAKRRVSAVAPQPSSWSPGTALSTDILDTFQSLSPMQQTQARHAQRLLSGFGCWPSAKLFPAPEAGEYQPAPTPAHSQDGRPPPVDAPAVGTPAPPSLLSRLGAPHPEAPPPAYAGASSSKARGSAQAASDDRPAVEEHGWDDQTAVDMDVDMTRAEEENDVPVKVKQEDTSEEQPQHLASAAAPARAQRLPTSISLQPPSSPAPHMQAVSQSTPAQSRPSPSPSFSPSPASSPSAPASGQATRSQPAQAQIGLRPAQDQATASQSQSQAQPASSQSQSSATVARSASPAVTGPVTALGKLSACYLAFKGTPNNITQLLQSKAMKPFTANIVAQIQITSSTAVAYFRNQAERSSFLLRLKQRDPGSTQIQADVGEVNWNAGLKWEDVREPHRAWLTLLCRKLATSPQPEGPQGEIAAPGTTASISPALRAEYARRMGASSERTPESSVPGQPTWAQDPSASLPAKPTPKSVSSAQQSGTTSSTIFAPSTPKSAPSPHHSLPPRPLPAGEVSAGNDSVPAQGRRPSQNDQNSARPANSATAGQNGPDSKTAQQQTQAPASQKPHPSVKAEASLENEGSAASQSQGQSIHIQAKAKAAPAKKKPAVNPLGNTDTPPRSPHPHDVSESFKGLAQNLFDPSSAQHNSNPPGKTIHEIPRGLKSQPVPLAAQKPPPKQSQAQQKPTTAKPLSSRNLSPPRSLREAPPLRRSRSPSPHYYDRPLLDSYVPLDVRIRGDRGPPQTRSRGPPPRQRSPSPPPRPAPGGRKRSYDGAMDRSRPPPQQVYDENSSRFPINTDFGSTSYGSFGSSQQPPRQQTSLIDRVKNPEPLSKRVKANSPPPPPPPGLGSRLSKGPPALRSPGSGRGLLSRLD